METKRPHIAYIDALRVVSAAGVIFMHTAATGLRVGVLAEAPFVTRGWHLMNLVTSFAFTAVPLFFMISGYLLFTDEKTADVGYLFRRRLPRLLVPLSVWTLLTAAWQGIVNGEGALGVLTRLRDAFLGPVIPPLWFMYTLIVLYLLSPFVYAALHAMKPGGHKLVLGVIALVSLRAALQALLPAQAGGWLSSLTLLNSLQALGGNLLLMLLGWYLGTWEKRVSDWALLALAVGTWLLIVIGTWLRTRACGYYDQSFQTQSAGYEVLLASSLFLLAKQRLQRPSRLLSAVPAAPLTMPIYLMHGLVLLVLFRLGVAPLRFPGILGVSVGVFVLCYLIAKTLASVKPLCYAFTGLRYDAACARCNWQWTFRRGKKETAE